MALIWTPEDPIDLLTVDIDGKASDEEIRGMIAINQAARNFVDGVIDPATYLDRLEYYGIFNPIEFVDDFIALI